MPVEAVLAVERRFHWRTTQKAPRPPQGQGAYTMAGVNKSGLLGLQFCGDLFVFRPRSGAGAHRHTQFLGMMLKTIVVVAVRALGDAIGKAAHKALVVNGVLAAVQANRKSRRLAHAAERLVVP